MAEVNMLAVHPLKGEIVIELERKHYDGGENDERLTTNDITQVIFGGETFEPENLEDDLVFWLYDQVYRHAWRYQSER